MSENEEADRLTVSALHFLSCSITVSVRSRPTSVPSQHPCPDAAAGSKPTTSVSQGLCHPKSSLLHRQRAEYVLGHLFLFRIGQANSSSCVHYNSSEILNRLLMPCSAHYVPTHGSSLSLFLSLSISLSRSLYFLVRFGHKIANKLCSAFKLITFARANIVGHFNAAVIIFNIGLVSVCFLGHRYKCDDKGSTGVSLSVIIMIYRTAK